MHKDIAIEDTIICSTYSFVWSLVEVSEQDEA